MCAHVKIPSGTEWSGEANTEIKPLFSGHLKSYFTARARGKDKLHLKQFTHTTIQVTTGWLRSSTRLILSVKQELYPEIPSTCMKHHKQTKKPHYPLQNSSRMLLIKERVK